MKKENEWFAGESEADGKQIITRGRLFLNPDDQCKTYPTRLEVQWLYKGDEKAMPTTDEEEVIDMLMNRLTTCLEQGGVALLTTVHIGAQQAVYSYYTRNVDEAVEVLERTFAKLPQLPINIGAENDPTWSDYREVLTKFGMNA